MAALVATTTAMPVCARNILTPQAEADYAKRLSSQPAIAERLKVPAGISDEEADALKFLYAYMATPDAVDYDADYYLENVKLALQAAREMPWGSKVPDREWRHFVLPVRVNNENLDSARRVFYKELKPRVQGLSMADAILEVNHWCHEKVSYQPCDPRTSSPLATVGNALGRCGEESTLAVAALRSVGIPARQVYTPRWAHTDDNHAWVEAWADGKWYFLGACEPEAVLNLAWFNAPASRGMLMTTKVTGAYDGPEEQLELTPISTIINVTENYAPVDVTTVTVTDSEGRPLKNARVRFSLYNYAEFFCLAEKKTDDNGQANFTSGKGDLVVWATDGINFGVKKVTAGEKLTLPLDKDSAYTGSIDLDIVPPAASAALPEVSPEAAALNDRRKAYEDSVRLAYVNTFISPERAVEICRELGIAERAANLLVRSRGNHEVIEGFLRATSPERRGRAVALLGALAEKDLHDVTLDVLSDHMDVTRGDENSPLFVRYVLNPRIEWEMLRPYKREILSSLTPEQIIAYLANPDQLRADLSTGLTLDTKYNPGQFSQSATGTLRYRTADANNRSIAFVAICRSIGVPARIDPVSHTTQWADTSGKWHDVSFTETASAGESNLDAPAKSTLKINNVSDLHGRQPKYYAQFTLSRVNGGVPRLMDFNDFETVESINSRNFPLPQSQYVLVSGQRLADGTVLAHADFFSTNPGEEAKVPLTVRQDTTALQVIGSLDAELLYTPIDGGAERSILSTTGRGYYALGLIVPGHEPSAHALNDIAAAARELESIGRPLVLLFPDADAASRFRKEDYGRLPSNVTFGIDKGGRIASALAAGLEYAPFAMTDYPVFVVADTFNRVIFARRGYTIHLGEELAKILGEVK